MNKLALPMTLSILAILDGRGHGSTHVLAGCSSDPSTVSETPICDGTDRLRVRFFVAPIPEREVDGSLVRVENGYPWLAIDGRCQYWMSAWSPEDPLARDRGVRTGTLDQDAAQELNQRVPLEKLGVLQDCRAGSKSVDGSSRLITDGVSSARCAQAGDRFDAAWGMIRSRADHLWSQGSPMTGEIRVALYLTRDNDTSKVYNWPLSEDMSSLALDYSQIHVPGGSHLISSPESASALRALRNEYLKDRDAAPGSFFDGPQVSDGKRTLYIYFRDVTSYEGPDGLMPFLEAVSEPPVPWPSSPGIFATSWF